MLETIEAPVQPISRADAADTVPSPLRALAERWLRDRRPAVEVRVSRHAGSVPRETGTRMLVARDEVAGTIGGGHLELKAIAEARQMLASATPRRASATIRSAPRWANAAAARSRSRSRRSTPAPSPAGPTNRRCSHCSSTAPATSAARS